MKEKEFLEKKEEYLNQLRENHPCTLDRIMKASNNNNLKVMDILLDPKNYNELIFAYEYFKNLEVVSSFIEMVNFGELEYSSPEESNAFNYILDYTKACLNNLDGNELQKVVEKYHLDQFDYRARMIFERVLVFKNDELYDLLFEKLGMDDKTDDITILKVNNYFAKALKILSLDEFIGISDEINIDKYLEFSNKYREIINDFIDKYSIKHNK